MSLTVRPLADDELPAAWELGRLAFGGPATAPERALRPVPGLLRIGALDERGRLVGKATDAGHEQWWGGRALGRASTPVLLSPRRLELSLWTGPGDGRAGLRPGRPGRAGPARLRPAGPVARLLLTTG